MKWIHSLRNSKLPYYIYKLNKNDSVIIFEKHKNNNEFIIILYGTLYIIKIFKNEKTIPIVILDKNNIFKSNKNNNEFYYKLIALETTYILKTKIKTTKIYSKINIKLIDSIIESYNKTIKIYESIGEVIKQKQTNKRVIQNIFLMLLNFGIMKNKQIYLPFRLSQKHLSLISQTSEGTTSKIIKKTNIKWNIQYSTNKLIQTQDLFNLTVQ
uniref:Global nitrogen transcriptional regulator n=1 Tax=Chondria sp. (in: red algae) TaxID=1982705 RepID=A0A1Z1MQP7_9FLOR|nr:global nitrogen transcriptional regulator [Chondria sp. (in: red algae)]